MKIGRTLVKASENFTVTIVENGFLFEISGRTENEDWKTVKMICVNREELDILIDEALILPRDE